MSLTKLSPLFLTLQDDSAKPAQHCLTPMQYPLWLPQTFYSSWWYIFCVPQHDGNSTLPAHGLIWQHPLFLLFYIPAFWGYLKQLKISKVNFDVHILKIIYSSILCCNSVQPCAWLLIHCSKILRLWTTLRTISFKALILHKRLQSVTIQKDTVHSFTFLRTTNHFQTSLLVLCVTGDSLLLLTLLLW
jgi:hypothetical protein